MADPCNASTTIMYFTFIYLLLIIPIAGDSPTPYKPDDQIFIDCGFSGNSKVFGDSRTWVGDVNSKFFPSHLLHNSASITSRAETQPSSVPTVPYVTARLSHSQFTYLFPVTPGQKFIRLYFYPASYPNFDRSEAVFSVRAGGYTLLRDFNASVNADASGSDTIFREFCMYADGNDETLNITFTPTNHHSYAFISGIEIVSMPINLYYTPPATPDNKGLRGLKYVGQNNKFFPIENYTALEMVYRINIGGNAISPAGDTGIFRTWSRENPSYLYDLKEDARPLNATIALNFSKIPGYTAPQDVYRTARSMGPNATINKSYNITWKYPVDPGFYYLLRLHFCEFEGPINYPGERVFLIYIHDLIAEESADVIRWAGGKGIPYYRDYVVFVSGNTGKKKVKLSVKLEANPQDWRTAWSNVILNGIEIFKLNDSNSNLAGQNPDPPPPTTTQLLPPSILESKNWKNRRRAIVVSAIVGGVVFCMVAMLVVGLFIFHLRRGRRHKDLTSNDGTSRWTSISFSSSRDESSSKDVTSSWWTPFSFSTTESSKARLVASNARDNRVVIVK